MNHSIVGNYVAPLLGLGEVLGVPAQTWASREELSRITYVDPELDTDRARKLELQHFTSVLNAFGEALTCRFKLGDLEVFNLVSAPPPDDLSIRSFREQIQHSPTVEFEFSIDKARLAGDLTGARTDCTLFVYLFPAALEAYLTNPLARLEDDLWGARTASKVVILVPGRDIALEGQYLAVVGGDRFANWSNFIAISPQDKEQLDAIYQGCRENLIWQDSWLEFLTPRHLRLVGQTLPDDLIAKALQVHFVNLVLLYTADRTESRNNGMWISTYAGATQSLAIALEDPTACAYQLSPANLDSLGQIFDWAYEDRTSDRLNFVQISIVHSLFAGNFDVRYLMLIQNAATILSNLKWHWKAFIEGKIETYTSEVRALEDYILQSSRAFSEQISALIKSISDTMLAAVAVLLGSFVAALFKDEFNPTIFRIGMITYVVYVAVFPLAYNMLHQWSRYSTLVNDARAQKKRFDQRLYPDTVEEIVGSKLTDSQKLLQMWYWLTLAAYILVVAGGLTAAFLLPQKLGAAIAAYPQFIYYLE